MPLSFVEQCADVVLSKTGETVSPQAIMVVMSEFNHQQHPGIPSDIPESASPDAIAAIRAAAMHLATFDSKMPGQGYFATALMDYTDVIVGKNSKS